LPFRVRKGSRAALEGAPREQDGAAREHPAMNGVPKAHSNKPLYSLGEDAFKKQWCLANDIEGKDSTTDNKVDFILVARKEIIRQLDIRPIY